MVGLRAETQPRCGKRSDEQQALVVKQDSEVDQLLQAGLQEDALAAQDRLNQTGWPRRRPREQVERLEAEYAQLAETKAQLDARIQTLATSEPEVERHGGAGAREATDRSRSGSRWTICPARATRTPTRVVGSIRTRLAEAEAQLAGTRAARAGARRNPGSAQA